ncbi:hypothetical protein DYY67_2263 [Candidatus Nitrosotalea sp. TS]|nr:hypothetical protein [Candidatus Nitrosotalea sp. TS]
MTVTVNDPDLNTNNDLVVIYTAVAPPISGGAIDETQIPDVATDTIGARDLGTYSDGTAIGRLLDIQFGQADIQMD